MKTTNDEILHYAKMGKAALLPGMVKMLDLMQRQIDEFRAELNGAESSPRRVEGATKRGRPRKNVESLSGRGLSGWPADPEERKKEMARRRKVAKAKKSAKLHPRDAAHPDHEHWKEIMRKAQKARWKRLTPAQQREAQARMQEARSKKAATVKLAVAS